MKTKITIEFDNKVAAKHFATWLCEQGEQNYWIWMEERETEEDGNITATSFHYHGLDNKQNFMNDNVIRTTCGRLSGNYIKQG